MNYLFKQFNMFRPSGRPSAEVPCSGAGEILSTVADKKRSQ